MWLSVRRCGEWYPRDLVGREPTGGLGGTVDQEAVRVIRANSLAEGQVRWRVLGGVQEG